MYTEGIRPDRGQSLRYSTLQEVDGPVMPTGDVISDKQTMEDYAMIDVAEGGTEVVNGQIGHVFIVSCHYIVR